MFDYGMWTTCTWRLLVRWSRSTMIVHSRSEPSLKWLDWVTLENGRISNLHIFTTEARIQATTTFLHLDVCGECGLSCFQGSRISAIVPCQRWEYGSVWCASAYVSILVTLLSAQSERNHSQTAISVFMCYPPQIDDAQTCCLSCPYHVSKWATYGQPLEMHFKLHRYHIAVSIDDPRGTLNLESVALRPLDHHSERGPCIWLIIWYMSSVILECNMSNRVCFSTIGKFTIMRVRPWFRVIQ